MRPKWTIRFYISPREISYNILSYSRIQKKKIILRNKSPKLPFLCSVVPARRVPSQLGQPQGFSPGGSPQPPPSLSLAVSPAALCSLCCHRRGFLLTPASTREPQCQLDCQTAFARSRVSTCPLSPHPTTPWSFFKKLPGSFIQPLMQTLHASLGFRPAAGPPPTLLSGSPSILGHSGPKISAPRIPRFGKYKKWLRAEIILQPLIQGKLRVFALEVFLKAYYKQVVVVVLENGRKLNWNPSFLSHAPSSQKNIPWIIDSIPQTWSVCSNSHVHGPMYHQIIILNPTLQL